MYRSRSSSRWTLQCSLSRSHGNVSLSHSGRHIARRTSQVLPLEEWPEAIEHFERVLQQETEGKDHQDSTIFSCHGIYWQLVRCYYEVKDYDKAIAVGQEALEETRHKLEAHKYMALSYKANGDIYAALKIRHRGVLYTLDNGDRQEAYELYEELRHELQG